MFPAKFKKQQGVAAVEFAIVIPLLAMLMLGTVELGRMLYQYNAIVKTTRDGARFASMQALNAADVVELDQFRPLHPYSVRRETQNLVVYGNTQGAGNPLLPGFAIADVSVTSPEALHVEIRVDYTYTPMIGNSLPILVGDGAIALNFPLVHSIKMRAH